MNEIDQWLEDSQILLCRQWLKANNRTLRKYTPDEMTHLAVLAGFPLDIAISAVCDRVILIKRLLTFWESPLSEKWMRVVQYEHGTEEV